MGWLPHLPGFALGTFVLALIAIWLPRTWASFAILAFATTLGSAAYGISASVASHVWLAAGFLAVVGYVSGLATLRFGALVALVFTAGATCGLNASPTSAGKAALMFGMGGMWSIVCGLGIPRPPIPKERRSVPVPTIPGFYPLRCALCFSTVLIVAHGFWPANIGWAPAAAAAVIRPDLAGTGQRAIGRLAVTFGAVILAALLLAIHVPALPAFALLLAMLGAAHWLGLDPSHANPFVATTIVLVVLGYNAEPDRVGAAFVQRIAENALGAAIAWLVVAVPGRPRHGS